MPFGAEIQKDGRVRFRLWAPAAEQVNIYLHPGAELNSTKQTILTMDVCAEGWFQVITEQATAGTRYHFLVKDHINEGSSVPDPASRFQPEDVHGPSEVIDPTTWAWRDTAWRGRPWEEAILYELHVGCFTPQGNFAGVQEKLDYLVALGITGIELMPVADFPGGRNWGYDGVYLFAPDSRYGRPDELKALVDAAHARDIMVFLDVVYNHFGPEGNYLRVTAPPFFSKHHQTPWGSAINFDGENSQQVREFFIHNALYWLEEYHLDGLRFDAVHTIIDDSIPDILTEMAQRIHDYFGAGRAIHLILENDHNSAHYLSRDNSAQPLWYTAQLNDDIHHALHVLLTSETDAYYSDYANNPLHHLGRCLTEGFAYQGEVSPYRDKQARGETSSYLPPTAFISFMQNHDQVGNRAFGERITALASPKQRKAALAILLLAPSPPLLFMGEEWGCTQAFTFFCDFDPDLTESVVTGRRQEFTRFAQFRDPSARARIPNPMHPDTFAQAILAWEISDLPKHQLWLELYRELIALRQRELIPRLAKITGKRHSYILLNEQALSVRWILGDQSKLLLLANLGETVLSDIPFPKGQTLYTTHTDFLSQLTNGHLPPWSVIWTLQTAGAAL
jgi:1,4-alpha-glucan branching enzyme/maltooligosyltrehalose trehalohydrolase